MKRIYLSFILMSSGITSSGITISAETLTERAPATLEWKNYDDVSSHASQSPAETLYFQIDWKDNVLDAQLEAQQADKEIASAFIGVD